MGDMIEFPSNGGTGQGYLALPEGSGPGVIVIQEWWGLVDHIIDVADRFAREGFVALAPDLYHGERTTEPDEAGKLMMSLSLDRAARDLDGALDALRGHERVTGEGLGVTGFCMGGGLAYVLAARRPDVVRAVVPFYGVVAWPGAQPDYSAISAAIQGHYGDRDAFLPIEGVRELEQQLKDLGKDVEFFVYPGQDHAFFNDTRPEVYDEASARQAWARTVEFLHRHLG